jgi:hypothetical protein
VIYKLDAFYDKKEQSAQYDCDKCQIISNYQVLQQETPCNLQWHIAIVAELKGSV